MKKEIIETMNIATIRNKYHSVKEYSYCEEKNGKFRDTMEDFAKIIDKYMNDPNKGFFSLYDGHGGSEVVVSVKERMPEILATALGIHPVEEALISTFKKVDEEIKGMNAENVGCTACIGLVINEGGKKYFYCANVGDSKCLLVCDKTSSFITEEHRCSNTDEVERVRKAGGIVFNGRVFGQLMLTRAIGDYAMKDYGVINTPFISKHVIDNKVKYAIIASDGIWDVMNEDAIMSIVNKYTNTDDINKSIVKDAIAKGSRDNISCIIIKF
jgi:serine/threonine protein phosphatase PrpC